MIRQQALLLCVFGIPLGLLLGYGIGVAAVPVALSASTYESKYTVISISPWILLFAAVSALLTVLLSCARPGRIAGNVSPVEAVRYTEVTGSRKRRRSSGKVSPASMAWANLGRNKKKTALVVLSLSLAVALLNMLATFLGGFDMDKYLSHESCADFIVSTPDYFRYQGSTLTEADIAPIRANTERSLEGFAYGVGSVQMYLPENIWREEAEHFLRDMDIEEMLQRAARDGDKIASYSQVEGLDADLLSKLTVIEGDLSPLLEPDNHAVAIAVNLDDDGTLSDPERYPAVGEQVKVTFDPAGARSDVAYTVCALVDVPYSMGFRFYSMGYEAVLAADTLRRDAGDKNLFPLLYLFDTPDADAEAAAESYLSNLTASSDSPLMYESKASHRAYFRQFQSTFAILGGLLCAITRHCGSPELRQRHDDLHPFPPEGIRRAPGRRYDRISTPVHAHLGGPPLHPGCGTGHRPPLRRREPLGGKTPGKRLLVLYLPLLRHPCPDPGPRLRPPGRGHLRGYVSPGRRGRAS